MLVCMCLRGWGLQYFKFLRFNPADPLVHWGHLLGLDHISCVTLTMVPVHHLNSPPRKCVYCMYKCLCVCLHYCAYKATYVCVYIACVVLALVINYAMFSQTPYDQSQSAILQSSKQPPPSQTTPILHSPHHISHLSYRKLPPPVEVLG